MQYTITLLNGDSFTGAAEEVARWYCRHENIGLRILPNEDSKGDSFENCALLYAMFYEDNPERELTYIAAFENIDTTPMTAITVRDAYRLFLMEYLMEDVEDSDWKITLS